MAYVINKTDGTAIVTITDGTVDNTTTVQLFGKSYSGFGEGLNENLVKLLENSASTSAPSAPLKGELWFDTTTNQLKVYDGTSFKPTGGAKVQNSQPTSPSAGDLWQDSTNNQLYFYTGSAWILVGPQYTAGQTLSGWKIETVTASTVSKVISSMYVGNIRVAVLSKETFTPDAGSPLSSPLATNGFPTITSGLTLNNSLGAVFDGPTTSATHLNVSSTSNTSASIIAGGNFLRADASDTTSGALTIDNDSGITIGDEQELTITIDGSGHAIIAQTREDKDLSVTINDNGVTKTPIAIAGSTGNITLTGTTGITGDVTITGNLTITGSYDKSSVDVSSYVDAFIGLNDGGNTNVDGGLIVEQNGGVEAKLFYDTSEGYWSAGLSSGSYEKIIRESDVVTDGDANKNTGFLRTDASGNLKVTSLTLGAVGTAITTSDTASVSVPTIGQVATFGNLWGGSAKTVSTVAPTSGDGSDGDFWFVREA